MTKSIFLAPLILTLITVGRSAPANEIEGFQSATEFGRFDAELSADLLTVTLRVFYEFNPGSPMLAPGYSSAEYQWNGNSKGEFKKDLEAQIEGTWSGKYLIARDDGSKKIRVAVDVLESKDLAGATWKIVAGHYPSDGADIEVSVCDSGQRHYPSASRCVLNDGNDRWGTLYIGSHQLGPDAVTVPVFESIWFSFKKGGADFADDPTETILSNDKFHWTVVDSMANRGWSIEIAGYANYLEDLSGSTAGQEFASIRIARKRLEKVRQYLKSKSVNLAKVRSVAAGEFHDLDGDNKVVELSILPYSMPTAAHEAGRMFGLPDEAKDSSRTDSFAIDDRFKALVMWYFDEVIDTVDENNVMSRGSQVLPHHYLPFLEAIEELAGNNQVWEIVDL